MRAGMGHEFHNLTELSYKLRAYYTLCCLKIDTLNAALIELLDACHELQIPICQHRSLVYIMDYDRHDPEPVLLTDAIFNILCQMHEALVDDSAGAAYVRQHPMLNALVLQPERGEVYRPSEDLETEIIRVLAEQARYEEAAQSEVLSQSDQLFVRRFMSDDEYQDTVAQPKQSAEQLYFQEELRLYEQHLARRSHVAIDSADEHQAFEGPQVRQEAPRVHASLMDDPLMSDLDYEYDTIGAPSGPKKLSMGKRLLHQCLDAFIEMEPISEENPALRPVRRPKSGSALPETKTDVPPPMVATAAEAASDLEEASIMIPVPDILKRKPQVAEAENADEAVEMPPDSLINLEPGIPTLVDAVTPALAQDEASVPVSQATPPGYSAASEAEAESVFANTRIKMVKPAPEDTSTSDTLNTESAATFLDDAPTLDLSFVSDDAPAATRAPCKWFADLDMRENNADQGFYGTIRILRCVDLDRRIYVSERSAIKPAEAKLNKWIRRLCCVHWHTQHGTQIAYR